MSIIESLRKLTDPVQARAAQEESRVVREHPKRAATGAPPHFRCRVCGQEEEQGGYCPRCLADTMKRVQQSSPRE
jgi:rubrerythrin